MDKNELNRLERAVDKANKKKNKQALYEWAFQLEQQLEEKLRVEYEEMFKQDLENCIDCFIIAIMYTLHFSEVTKLGPKRIKEVMEDITSTVDMFNSGEYSPEEYKKILEKDKIFYNIKR